MTTRQFKSLESAEVAELTGLIAARPDDLIDPFPHTTETELLADSGARGKDESTSPRVATVGDEIVGYGALDFSPDLRRAHLIGPVVHPGHRRRGLGRALLADLQDQAKQAHQKYVRAAVGAMNRGGQAFLTAAGLKQQERHTCLSLQRPERFVTLEMEGITLRRAFYEDADEVYRFTQRLVPRTFRQVKSLLRTDAYAITLAHRQGKPVGYVEVDMRRNERASLEHLDGQPSLIHKGLGNLMLADAIRTAFEPDRIQHLDLLVSGADRARLEAYAESGFHIRHELISYEAKL